MAKQSNVQFLTGIDELRGKLATKQKNIRYQTQPANADSYYCQNGKQRATNFKPYIVFSKRNDTVRFFVKSRTSINWSDTNRMQMAAIAISNILTDKAMTNAGLVSQINAAFRIEKQSSDPVTMISRYDTPRDWVRGVISEQLLNGEDTIAIYYRNPADASVLSILIGDNPLIKTEPTLEGSMTYTLTEYRVIYKFLSLTGNTINISMPDGKVYKMAIKMAPDALAAPASDFNDSVTFKAQQFELDAQSCSCQIINPANGHLVAAGKRYALFEDAARETAVGEQTQIAVGTTFYASETLE